MAYSLVAAGTASGTPTFGASTTAGNLLVCLCTGSSTTSSTSPGWVKAKEQISGAGSSVAAVWYKPNCGSGETAPTITNLATGALFEFSGGDTSSPVDQTGGNNIVGSSPIVAACGSADIQAGELFVSAGNWILTKSATCTTADTYNNGATPTTNLNNDGSSVSSHYRFAWGTTTGNAAADQTSQSNGSMNISSGSVAVASFKLASTARLPRNPAINHTATALLAKAHSVAEWWRRLRPLPSLRFPQTALQGKDMVWPHTRLPR